MAIAALDVENLNRSYITRGGENTCVLALRGISMRMEPGEVRALLGPNGAGKTTFVKILSTVLLPTSGRASIFGLDVVADVREVRRRVGVVLGGDRGLYGTLTARQNLEYWCALYGLDRRESRSRSASLLAKVGLDSRADDLVEGYSRGMKQRLHIARGLVADPQLILLDEPSIGLDPVGAAECRDLVKELKESGKTILITTHDMREAEELADTVALIAKGRLLAMQTAAGLAGLVESNERIEYESANPSIALALKRLRGVVEVEHAGGKYVVRLEQQDVIPAIIAQLAREGVTSLRTTRPSLEEIYLKLMKDLPESVEQRGGGVAKDGHTQ